MKDKLIDTLQERFSGHEASVDPGVWQSISGQLAHAASGEGLRQTLQQKFTGHEAHVDPSAWSNISSQLGQGAAGGTGIGAGWMAAGIAGIALIGGLFFWSTTSPDAGPKMTVALGQEALPQTTSVAEQKQVVLPSPTPAKAVDQTAQPSAPHSAITPTVTTRTSASSSTNSGDTRGGENSVTGPQPTSKPSAEGEQVVQSVLQELVTENMVRTAAFPPPTTNELPDKHIAIEEHPKVSEPNEPVVEPAINQAPEPNLFIPNVFSPNGDGINEKLEVTGQHYVNSKVLVRIFSAKNSTLVFSSDNLATSWDGHDLRGMPCEEGYYFYAIEVTGEDGQAYSKGETVRLFRN